MEEENVQVISEKNRDGKPIKARAKRYLTWFVILMILCILISRATASVTTPIITYTSPSRGNLTFRIDGVGTIESPSEVYTEVQPNMKVDFVSVNVGDTVPEGQELFRYDMKELGEQVQAEKEKLQTLEQSYQKFLLTTSLQQSSATTDAQELTLQRAQEDYEAAVTELEASKDKYQAKIVEVEKELSEEKQTEYERAVKVFDDANEALESLNETYEKTYEDAQETVVDATKSKDKLVSASQEELKELTESLSEFTEKKEKLESGIDAVVYYAGLKDYLSCNTAMESVYQIYFGKDAYQSILDQREDAKEAISKAVDNQNYLNQKWNLTINNYLNQLSGLEFGSATYLSVYNDYSSQLIERDRDLTDAQDAIDSARKRLDQVNKKYTQIDSAYTTYRNTLIGNLEDTESKLYLAFYNSVMDDTILDEKAYEKAKKDVTKQEASLAELSQEQDELIAKAQETVTDVKAEWDKKVEKAEETVNEAQEGINKVLGKEYSGKDILESAWSSVEAQQGVVKQAKRILEDAIIALQTAKDSLSLANQNAAIQNKIDELEQSSLESDIADQENRIKELEALSENDGIVCSTVAGMVSKLDVSSKSSTSGNERVSIEQTSNVFTGTYQKDDAKYVEKGAEISCQLNTMDKAVECTIDSIRYDQANNNYIFTATLPNGDYLPNTGGTYTYTKQSAKYDTTIPINALRQDMNGYYVLIVEEQSSVLGTELVATRINVEFVDKDSKTAVVNNLYPEMKVITGSSRNITEGDRVRVGSYE